MRGEHAEFYQVLPHIVMTRLGRNVTLLESNNVGTLERQTEQLCQLTILG